MRRILSHGDKQGKGHYAYYQCVMTNGKGETWDATLNEDEFKRVQTTEELLNLVPKDKQQQVEKLLDVLHDISYKQGSDNEAEANAEADL